MFLLDTVHSHRRSLPCGVPPSTPFSTVAERHARHCPPTFAGVRRRAVVAQRATCSGHYCPVLCRADNRHCHLLILVLLHLVLLELSRKSLFTERRARPWLVQCVSLAFHANERIILGITGTRHVELVYRIRDALDPLVWYFCPTATARVCIVRWVPHSGS